MSAIVEKLEKINCDDTMRCVCLQRVYVPRCGCGDRKGWGNRAAALRVPELEAEGPRQCPQDFMPATCTGSSLPGPPGRLLVSNCLGHL